MDGEISPPVVPRGDSTRLSGIRRAAPHLCLVTCLSFTFSIFLPLLKIETKGASGQCKTHETRGFEVVISPALLIRTTHAQRHFTKSTPISSQCSEFNDGHGR